MKKLLILAVCFATLAAQAQLQMNFGKESPLQKLQIAEMAIKNLYVDTVNENKLAEDAIKGMLEKLTSNKVILGTTTHGPEITTEEMKNFSEQAEIPPSKSDFQSIKIKIPITS